MLSCLALATAQTEELTDYSDIEYMFTMGTELDVSQSWNVDLLEDKELKVLNSQAGNVLGVMLTADKATLSNVAWTYDANW